MMALCGVSFPVSQKKQRGAAALLAVVQPALQTDLPVLLRASWKQILN